MHWLFEGHDNPQQEETTQATESAINATMDAERSCASPQNMSLQALRSAFAAHAAAVDITPTQLESFLTTETLAMLPCLQETRSLPAMYSDLAVEAVRTVRVIVHAVRVSGRTFALEVDDTLAATGAEHLSAVVVHCPGALAKPRVVRIFAAAELQTATHMAGMLLQCCVELGLPIGRLSCVLGDNAALLAKAVRTLRGIGQAEWQALASPCALPTASDMCASQGVTLDLCSRCAAESDDAARGSADGPPTSTVIDSGASRAALAAATGVDVGDEGMETIARRLMGLPPTDSDAAEDLQTADSINAALLVRVDAPDHSLEAGGSFKRVSVAELRGELNRVASPRAGEPWSGLSPLRDLRHHVRLDQALNLVNQAVQEPFRSLPAILSTMAALGPGGMRTRLQARLQAGGAWSRRFSFDEAKWGSRAVAMEAIFEKRAAILRVAKEELSRGDEKLEGSELDALRAAASVLTNTRAMVELAVAMSVLRLVNSAIVAFTGRCPSPDALERLSKLPLVLRTLFGTKELSEKHVREVWTQVVPAEAQSQRSCSGLGLFLDDPARASFEGSGTCRPEFSVSDDTNSAVKEIAEMLCTSVSSAIEELNQRALAITTQQAVQAALDPTGDAKAGFELAKACLQAPQTSETLTIVDVARHAGLLRSDAGDLAHTKLQADFALFLSRPSPERRATGREFSREFPEDAWSSNQMKHYPALQRLAQEAWLVPQAPKPANHDSPTGTTLFIDTRHIKLSGECINSQLILRANSDLVEAALGYTLRESSVTPSPPSCRTVLGRGAESQQRGTKRPRSVALDDALFPSLFASVATDDPWADSPAPASPALSDASAHHRQRRCRAYSYDTDEE